MHHVNDPSPAPILCRATELYLDIIDTAHSISVQRGENEAACSITCGNQALVELLRTRNHL